MSKKQSVNASLTLDASVSIEAGAGDKPAIIHIAAYNGGLMSVAPHGPLVIDVEGVETGDRVPLLADHDNRIEAVLGSGATIKDGGRLVVDGTLSRTNPLAERVISLHADGVPLQASVGAQIVKAERVPKGKKAFVNGRELRAEESGFLVIRKSVLRHVAIVPNGADASTAVSIAASAASKGVQDMAQSFEAWLEENEMDASTLSKKALAAMRKQYKLAQAASSEDDDESSDEEDKADAKRKQSKANAAADLTVDYLAQAHAERNRQLEIDRLVQAHINPRDPYCDLEGLQELRNQAIEGGWSVKDTELALLRRGKARPNVGVPRGSSEKPSQAVLAAALLLRCGMSDESLAKDRDFGPQVTEQAWKMRRGGLHSLFAAALKADGIYAPHDGDELYREAITQTVKAQYSTISLPGLVGTVGNKLLLDSFNRVDGTYSRIAQQADFNNFLTYNMYRLDHLGEFAKVGPTGELKSGQLDETNYTNRLETRGQILTIPREAIVNDDLNAFSQLFDGLGRKAALAVERALFSQVMEGSDSFYTTARGNRLTGKPLSVNALGDGEAAMLAQVAEDGDPIYGQPAILLVPPGLKFLADSLYTSAVVNQTPANNTAQGVDNPYRGRFRVESSPYLALSGMTGSSATTWYLLAEPSNLPAFQVAYLRGQRQPTIETADAQFNTLGIQMRCYFDFGVARVDYRGAVKVSA